MKHFLYVAAFILIGNISSPYLMNWLFDNSIFWERIVLFTFLELGGALMMYLTVMEELGNVNKLIAISEELIKLNQELSGVLTASGKRVLALTDDILKYLGRDNNVGN